MQDVFESWIKLVLNESQNREKKYVEQLNHDIEKLEKSIEDINDTTMLEKEIKKINKELERLNKERDELESEKNQHISNSIRKFEDKIKMLKNIDNREAIKKAGEYFGKDFSKEAPAQIEKIIKKNAQKIDQERKGIQSRLNKAYRKIEKHNQVVEEVKSLESDIEDLENGINEIMNRLIKHQVDKKVVDSILSMKIHQLKRFIDAILDKYTQDAVLERKWMINKHSESPIIKWRR